MSTPALWLALPKLDRDRAQRRNLADHPEPSRGHRWTLDIMDP
jgi:hypothetical protein